VNLRRGLAKLREIFRRGARVGTVSPVGGPLGNVAAIGRHPLLVIRADAFVGSISAQSSARP
jgi:hypothetical protein